MTKNIGYVHDIYAGKYICCNNLFQILNGHKAFVVNGISADFIVVFAVTETVNFDKESENSITAFIVEKDTPGVSWTKVESANVELAEITFENVQVPVGTIEFVIICVMFY